MLFASLVIAAAPMMVQDPFAAPLDYSNPGTSVAAVIRELAEKSGTKIEASEAMTSEYIALHTANRPLVETMDAIARTVSGAWVQQGDRFILNADIARRNAERTESENRRFKDLNDTIMRLRMQPAERYKDEDGEPARPEPSALAWASIYSKLNPRQVMLLEPNQRVVFASRPNAMQLPLPNIEQELAVLIEEHNSMEGMFNPFEDIPEEVAGDANMAKIMQLSQKYGGMPQGRVNSAPAKVLLAVENQSMMWGFGTVYLNVELILFNSEGKVVMREMQQIYSSSEFPMEVVADSLTTTTRQDGDEETPADQTNKELEELKKLLGIDEEKAVRKVEIPSTTTELNKLARTGMMGMMFFRQQGPSPELLAMLRQPTVYDPMGLTDGVYYVGFAKALDAPIVVNLEDVNRGFSYQDEPTVLSILGVMSSPNLKVTQTKGWIEVRPELPYDIRKNRTNRAALQMLIGRYEAKGYLSLDDVGDYAAVNRQLLGDMVATPAATMLMPGVMGGGGMMMFMGGTSNWQSLRFYGSLDRSKRQTLRRGGSLSFGSLSQNERAQLFPLIYGAEANLFNPDPEDEKTIKEEFGGFMYKMFMQGGLSAGTFLDEPTEAAPNGLVPQGLVESNIVNTFALQPVDGSGKTQPMLGNLGLEEIVMYESVSKMMSQFESAGSSMMPSVERVKVGSRLEMTLTIRPSATARATHILTDDQFTGNQTYAMNQLPQEANTAYETAKRQMATWEKLMMFGFGGMERGERPPP